MAGSVNKKVQEWTCSGCSNYTRPTSASCNAFSSYTNAIDISTKIGELESATNSRVSEYRNLVIGLNDMQKRHDICGGKYLNTTTIDTMSLSNTEDAIKNRIQQVNKGLNEIINSLEEEEEEVIDNIE